MKRLRLIWLLAGILILASAASCYGPVLTPGGEPAAPSATAPTSAPSPAATGTAVLAIQAPLGANGTRAYTATPISSTAPVNSQHGTAVAGAQISTPFDPALLQMVSQARENLAKRLGVGVDQVEPGEARAVDWPDTSLDCPLPGMAYAQVITPGYRIALTAGGKTYEYHADSQGRVVYCDSKGAQPLLGGESSENVRLAKEDLARRLGVSIDSITVGVVIGQEFSTDAFYCRTTKDRIAKDESPQVVSGQSILLSMSGRRYEYHASGQTVIFCRPLL